MVKHNRPQRIIRAVPRRYLLDELSADKLLGETHHANNLIYVVDAADSPAVMTEIGRLREVAFRRAGGGTGRRVDIDSDDLAPNGYRQMVVWNPYERQIVGGYRFIISRSEWPQHLSTEHYYTFSPRFRRDYLPHTIELGRSFIQPRFQSGRGGLFALDNLWDGMGAVVSRSEGVKYLFGKVTVYPHINPDARQLLYTFLRTQCPATEGLVSSRESCRVEVDVERYKNL
ncbi:MAG: GNAT family N-acetyltransferase, partial [Rikenellaceae bacterium]|nr:GNAT family N-acetyltransferase [Rikenellaceae bacterium]